jgi:hypothetical protein
MKRPSRDRSQKDAQVIRLWTYDEAIRAWPYIRSLMNSIREHWLAMYRGKRETALLEGKPGRPDRQTLVQIEECRRETERAEEALDEVLRELVAMDVYCLDPAGGLALIPFRKGDDLAWFVCDLFEPEGLRSWRFHHDPLPERRPITESEKEEASASETKAARTRP